MGIQPEPHTMRAAQLINGRGKEKSGHRVGPAFFMPAGLIDGSPAAALLFLPRRFLFHVFQDVAGLAMEIGTEPLERSCINISLSFFHLGERGLRNNVFLSYGVRGNPSFSQKRKKLVVFKRHNKFPFL